MREEDGAAAPVVPERFPGEQTVEIDYDGVERENKEEAAGEITEPFDPTKIRVSTSSPSIDLILKRMQEDEIELAPDFQRRPDLWSDQQQSRLIESILVRIPLPAFYFDATNEDRWIVVDGLQRLTTLKRFAITKELKLSGLEFLDEWNDKNFDGLPRKLQRRIEETQVTAFLIDKGTPTNVKFNIFKRINTTGLPLSPQEIRHALNQGPVVEMLKNLAESEEFRSATDRGVSPRRMVDRECALRFLAFSISPFQEYRAGDIDAFLNEQMAKINQLSDIDRTKLRERFLRAMRAAAEIFGNDAFRKRFHEDEFRYPVNKALFEAWSVSLDARSDEELELLVERRDVVQRKFRRLMTKSQFETAVSQGTGDSRKVKERFRSISRLLDEVLE